MKPWEKYGGAQGAKPWEKYQQPKESDSFVDDALDVAGEYAAAANRS